MTGTSIAVTGAGGFIGGRLATLLAREGFAPRPLLRRDLTLDTPDAVAAALAGCQALVHCAYDAYDEAANIRMADRLGEACAAAGIRLVHLSTAAVYEPLPDGVLTEDAPTDQPGTRYKAVKLAVEQRLLQLAATRGLDLVILQPTIVYGPGGGAWTDSPVRELLTGDVLLPDAGQGLCNAVFVDDVCQAAIAACTARIATGERLLVSGPAPVSWAAFLGAYAAMLGTSSLHLEPAGRTPPRAASEGAPPPAPGPLRALRGALLGRLGAARRSQLQFAVQRLRGLLRGRRRIVADGARRALYEARCQVSTSRAEALLGYRPRFGLADGMEATESYVRRAYLRRGGNTHAPAASVAPDMSA